VSVGLNEQDAFFALGVAPVGVTDWMGFEHGIGPWAQTAAKAAGDPPELLTNTDGIQFEKVAALRPDVIVALYSDLKRSDYEKLSQIAPIVAAGLRRLRHPLAGDDADRGTDRRRARRGGEADRRPPGAHREGQGRAPGVRRQVGVDGDVLRGHLGVRPGRLALAPVQLLDLDAVAWFATDDEAKKLERNRVYNSLDVHKEGRDFVVLDSRSDDA
jgi:iron complex transport system substrate-binding protein